MTTVIRFDSESRMWVAAETLYYLSEKSAVEAAIKTLRLEEQRLYAERRALEARLDEIEGAEVEVEQNLDGGDWDDIERAGLKLPPLRTSSTKGYK